MGAFSVAADIFDPPAWEPKNRPPALPYQLPPPGTPGRDWMLWVLEAGRGAGKTEACSRYFCQYMRRHPHERARIIAPTFGDAVEACIEGPSGIMSMDPEALFRPSSPGGAKVFWPNGSQALVIGLHKPRDVDRLRAGGNRGLDWWEEMAAIPQLKDGWDQAAFGLRRGQYPHSIASTTPRNTTEYRAIRAMDQIVLTKASLFDNPHLPEKFVKEMIKKYEGTRLGRQELRGELLDDIEGALWNRFMMDAARLPEGAHIGELAFVVVAIDPAATSSEEADDTGMVVVGLGRDGKGYLLEDLTCHLPPDGWATRAVRAYHRWKADLIVGERNNGGEMVEAVVMSADPTVSFKSVNASRGKQTRAQPIATLYGDGKARPSRVHHVGLFPELEDQLTSWVPGEADSPDRLDALVWGFTELFYAEQEEEDTVIHWEPVRIGADL